jgi:hypothetical protein
MTTLDFKIVAKIIPEYALAESLPMRTPFLCIGIAKSIFNIEYGLKP